MRIDSHQHVYWHGRDAAGLVADMDAHEIDRAWLLSWDVLPHEDERAYHGVLNPLNIRPDGTHSGIPLSDLLRARDAYPDRFVLGYCPHPQLAEAPKLFEAAVQIHGARVCGEWKFRMCFDDPRCLEVYRVAGRLGCPVVLHLDVPYLLDAATGAMRYQQSWYGGTIDPLERALDACPETIFIGHAPGFWREISGDCATDPSAYPNGPIMPGGRLHGLFERHTNLYADLSAGSALNALKRDLAHARAFLIRFADRLLFGRDFYGGDLIDLLGTLELPVEVQERIFYKNALHLVPHEKGSARMMAMLLMAMVTGQATGQTSVRYSRDYESGRLIVTLVAPEIVRVELIPKGANTDFPRIPIVLLQPAPKDRFAVRSAATYTELTASRLRVRVHNEAPRVDLYTADGKPLSLDAEGVTNQEGSLRDTRVIAADEEFFGGGLQFHSMAQRGRTKTLRVNADPSTDLGNSHAVVPFFLSTASYGIFLDSHAKTQFDLGKAAPDRLSFQTPDPVIDYYLCLGPTFHDLLARYTQLTGRMPMPPKWGLGFWYRMKSEWKQDKVEEVTRAFRTHDIPCDVIGLEPAWQTHAYSCSYIWNHAQFPDPKAFVATLRDEGFHVNLWEHAYVHPTSPIHDALQKANVVGDKLVWGGLVPDFTRPEARTLFADLHQKEHIDLGVDGYKLDECDGSDFTGGWFFPDDTHFPSGMTGAQMHNVFGLLYQKTFHEFFDRMNRRSYFLCRGMFAGAQGYDSVIYSDWYGFREYVRAAANSGFSGVLWCPEVRQTDDPKEFVRRFQTVFFSPLAMINAWADGVTPWEKGPEVERIFRRYADLRMQLMPYLYSAFWRMHRTGLPVVRALVMDAPSDRQTYDVDDEFLYGDSLLVAPVLQGDSRRVYLPHGPWIDWWTGATYAGEQTIETSAPLDQLPLFVRAGAIVPMQPRMRHAGEMPIETLTLRVFPGSESAGEPFTLYEDDGETLNYLQGAGVQTELRCTATPESVVLQASAPRGAFTPTWKRFVWEVKGVDRAPKRVLLSGRALPQLADDSSAVTGYRYDDTAHLLRIITPYGKAQSIRITR